MVLRTHEQGTGGVCVLSVETLPSQHELGVLGGVLQDEVLQQGLHHLREVLQLVVERHGEQAGHVAAVPLGEALLGLQGVDELHTDTVVTRYTQNY